MLSWRTRRLNHGTVEREGLHPAFFGHVATSFCGRLAASGLGAARDCLSQPCDIFSPPGGNAGLSPAHSADRALQYRRSVTTSSLATPLPDPDRAAPGRLRRPRRGGYDFWHYANCSTALMLRTFAYGTSKPSWVRMGVVFFHAATGRCRRPGVRFAMAYLAGSHLESAAVAA